MSVRVQEADFDLGAEIAAFHTGRPNIGAVASLIGTVHDINDGTGVSEVKLERYSGMTEEVLADIVSAAMQRRELTDALAIHRVDRLRPQDQIVLMAVASKYRGESFATCEFIMDYFKSKASFWKKEQTLEGARRADTCITDDKTLVC